MIYYFSKALLGFYLSELKEVYEQSGSWPEDAVEISESEYLVYRNMSPEGKILSADSKGKPIWSDKPEATTEELILVAQNKVKTLISDAMIKLNPLQFSVDLGIATEDENSELILLKNYIVELNRVKSQAGYPKDIIWPISPDIQTT